MKMTETYKIPFTQDSFQGHRYCHLEKCSYLLYTANVIYNIIFPNIQRNKVIPNIPVCLYSP